MAELFTRSMNTRLGRRAKSIDVSSGIDNASFYLRKELDPRASPQLGQIQMSQQKMKRGYKPSNIDILCGRGKKTSRHPGNVRFREVVLGNLHDYMALPSRLGKTWKIIEIVGVLRASGCKFLRIDTKSKQWYDIGDKGAREKVGHALRDAQTDHHQRLQAKPEDLPPITPAPEASHQPVQQKLTIVQCTTTKTPPPSPASPFSLDDFEILLEKDMDSWDEWLKEIEEM